MARSFRFYGKKRGNRRTGSPMLGSVGEALFWAVLLLLGCGGAVWMVVALVVPEWRVHHEFVETQCKVLDKRINQKPGDDGPLFGPELKIEYNAGGDITTWTHYDIHNAYTPNRREAEAILEQFAVPSAASGPCYPCWYDPADPYVVVLVRGYRWGRWFWLTVPGSFMAIGAGGLLYALLHWGKSAERRAARRRRAAGRNFLGGRVTDRRYPFVPQSDDTTNSPGTRLRFRLPMASSPGWALFGLLTACVLWNALVAACVWVAAKSHLRGEPQWVLTFFLIPFVLIGIGLIVFFFRKLLVAAGIGPTLMEISDHPLRPGQSYRLFLSQSGRLAINALRVWLVCEESATYRQGTNTRTETQEAFRQPVFVRERFQIDSGQPFVAEFDLNVPAGAMHSFKAEHNEINWSVVVEGDMARWPNFRRSFSVVLYPVPGSADR
ncbi:MAG: hypothetical protein ABFC77_03680 [Thermoguttaceae bacterium]